MIILIDNYDSFSYNLYQLAGSVEPDIRVIRNDRYTVQEIAEMEPEALILSPGPGRPENAGICIEAVRYFTGRIPILGVCLGHQAICEAFGGKVSYAGELMHGKQRTIYVKEKSRLFDGMGDSFPAGGAEDYSGVGRWRDHGGRTQRVSCFRRAVSSGICDDATGTQNHRKFYENSG